MHTIFQYSFYKAEFLERKILATYHNGILLALYSINEDKENTEGDIHPTTYFSIYNIREKESKTQITIYLHINPNFIFAPLSKNVFKKLLLNWVELLVKSIEK